MKYTDIKFVKRLEKEETTYSWFVGHKSNRVSDSENYINYENNKTVVKDYPMENLPKNVQKFIANHNEEIFTEEDDFTTYIIK